MRGLTKSFFTNYELDVIWLCRVCVICSVFMLGFPVPEGYDISQHLRSAATFQEAILDGSFVPAWAAVDNLGFGSVGIRFYPPFADYVLAVTQIFFDDWRKTLLINAFLWIFPGSIGLYLWTREFRSPAYSALSAVLYAAMPYHLLQIYRMQLYSEYVASAILPFCFLFATKLIRRGGVISVLGLSISCSLLILTHLPSTIIGLSGLAIYIFFLINWKKASRVLVQLGTAALITMAASAFYLVRLITEVEWVKHNSIEYRTGFFDFRLHLFPVINNFGEGYWNYQQWRIDPSIILTSLFFIPLLLCVFQVRKTEILERFEHKVIIAVFVTGLYSVFMLSVLSGFVWGAVTALQKIQFPWRFLTLVSAMAAISFSLAVPIVLDRLANWKRLFLGGCLLAVTGTILFDIGLIIIGTPQLPLEPFYKTVVDNRRDESCACWFPTWANRNALVNRERVFAGNRGIDLVKWQDTTREFTIHVGEPLVARINTFYYPHWKAQINGQPAEVKMDENGVILLDIPAERSEVNVYFEEPFLVNAALWISLITWAVLLIALILLGSGKIIDNFQFNSVG